MDDLSQKGVLHAAGLPASPWLVRFAGLIAPGGEVLDLACGHGRHARWLAAQGFALEAVDRDGAALATLCAVPGIRIRQADLEQEPWPYAGHRFAAIVVCNYLHRPLFPALIEALAPGGLLLYETFMLGNERFGRPSNPEFLLHPGELLHAFGASLQVVAFEQGEIRQPKRAVVQRLCAVKGREAARLP